MSSCTWLEGWKVFSSLRFSLLSFSSPSHTSPSTSPMRYSSSGRPSACSCSSQRNAFPNSNWNPIKHLFLQVCLDGHSQEAAQLPHPPRRWFDHQPQFRHLLYLCRHCFWGSCLPLLHYIIMYLSVLEAFRDGTSSRETGTGSFSLSPKNHFHFLLSPGCATSLPLRLPRLDHHLFRLPARDQPRQPEEIFHSSWRAQNGITLKYELWIMAG